MTIANSADLTVTGGVITNRDFSSNRSTLASILSLSSDSGFAKYVALKTSGSNRWAIMSNASVETGSNVGSDFEIRRYADNGSLIDAPISASRSTGVVSFSQANSVLNGLLPDQSANTGKYLVTNGSNASWSVINNVSWSSVTSTPATILGYGITDAYTKTEVDNFITGLDFKQSVRAVTTANIALSGTQTIDGVALTVGDRVLVKSQTAGSENGIYVVASGSWTRATDADGSPTNEVTAGMYCFVEEGTANADSGWVLATDGPIAIGTTALTFTQFNGLGQVVAGAGLTKTGNTLDVGTASSSRIVVNADDIDLAIVSDSGGGSFLKFSRDSHGRVSGTSPVVQSDLTGLGVADDSLVVHKAGTETITGNKTFSGTATVQEPTSASHAASKRYAENFALAMAVVFG